jgi:hypothetical protein
MTEHAQPSGDPADDDSLAGTLRAAFRKFMQQTDDMLPARVVAFDRDKNRATVAPLVAVLTTDRRVIQRAQVASVPVMQFGGGGVVLNFNLKPGDLGWLKASDRDISLFLQSYNASQPNTLRMHSFSDGVFIPEVMRGWTIAGEDAEQAVLQTLDGSVRVSLGDSRLRLAFDAHTVTLDAAGVTAVAGANSLAVTPAGITIAGPVTITGAVTTTGGLTVDGIGFGAHKHTNVQPGGGQSGGPTN